MANNVRCIRGSKITCLSRQNSIINDSVFNSIVNFVFYPGVQTPIVAWPASLYMAYFRQYYYCINLLSIMKIYNLEENVC